MKKLAALITTYFLMPAVAFAQFGSGGQQGTGQDALGLIDVAKSIIDRLIIVFIAAGIAVFIFGIVKYVIASDEEAKSKGRNLMIWGIIGLFAIVAVWGLVSLLANTTGVGPGTNSYTPDVPVIQ